MEKSEKIWIKCIEKTRKFFPDYIYDKEFQECFKMAVKNEPDGILFGDPMMIVSKYNNKIFVDLHDDIIEF